MKFNLKKIWLTLWSRFGIAGILLILGVLVIEVIDGRELLRGDMAAKLELSQKVAANTPLTINERITLGVMRAELVITVLGAILFGLCWFWAKKLPEGTVKAIDRETLGWPVLILLMSAMILGGFLRAPRLDHSLWNDEELAVRKYIVGSHREDPKTGELKFYPVPWERTLFYSLSGNNHIVQSVASRMGNTIWAKATGAPRGAFSETALRVGSFFAAIATIGFLGYWLGRAGFPLAGVTAAFILALNPWHIRYAVEARGYSILLFFVVLLLFALRSALITNRWRWWLCFGAAQALALLSFAASLFFVLAVNLVVLVVLINQRNQYGFWRWFFVCTCGAGLVALFMFPTIIGSMGWLKDLNETELNSQDWPRELWGHMMLGTHWYSSQPQFEYGIGIRNMMADNFAKQAIISVGIPLLTLAGLALIFGKKLIIRLHLGILLGAFVIVLIFRQFTETPFHVWYAIYVIFLFVIPFSFLAESPKLVFSRRISKPWQNWIPMVLILIFYTWISHEPRSRIIQFERHPMRYAVLSVRGSAPAISPESGAVRTVAFGSGAKQLLTYDPRVEAPRSIAEFEAIRDEVKSTGTPLAVYVVGPKLVKRHNPDLIATLEDPELFDKGPFHKGIEAFWCIQVYRAKSDR